MLLCKNVGCFFLREIQAKTITNCENLVKFVRLSDPPLVMFEYHDSITFSRATAKAERNLSSLSCMFLCVEWGHPPLRPN